ncbi:hypothetical protein J6590_017665 [Homalodisca vitripennis]|nr:hypothetical protein J6590_017665 [Homalodisca vitripennis]
MLGRLDLDLCDLFHAMSGRQTGIVCTWLFRLGGETEEIYPLASLDFCESGCENLAKDQPDYLDVYRGHSRSVKLPPTGHREDSVCALICGRSNTVTPQESDCLTLFKLTTFSLSEADANY